MDKIFKIIFDAIVILLIVLLAIYFLLRICGVANIYKVKTGSMEDGIHTGDYILIFKKKTYKVGDVVTFKKDGYYVTHRIVKKNGNKVITKGDANNIEDEEININSIIGKVIYTGGILNFLIDYKFFIAGFLIFLYLITWYFEKNKKNKTQKE